MTREEAIKIIDCYDIGFYDLSGEKIPADKLANAFDLAIEALQAPTDGDLIRREGILHELAELSDSYEKQYPREKEMIHGLILICRKAILNYPSADRPTEAFGTMCGQSNQAIEYALEHIKADRPTGEWIHDGVDVEGGVDWMHCSNCGKSDVWADATRTNYCPNCGARMKGGAE